MKPRLKPTKNGGLRIVQKGLNPWGEASARKFIQEHYGSLSAFASRFGFSYSAVCTALRTSYRPARMAGQVAEVRQALGLPSQPSPRALLSVKGKQQEPRA